MPNNEIIFDEQAMPETGKEKFEREHLTRRQALKRFGITSAMTAFALFSVDDLAHIVGKAMQQRAGDNKIAGQLAKEFQEAGIAMAAGPSGRDCCAQVAYDKANCIANALQTYAPYHVGCFSLAPSCIALNLQAGSCANEANAEIQKYCAPDCTYK